MNERHVSFFNKALTPNISSKGQSFANIPSTKDTATLLTLAHHAQNPYAILGSVQSGVTLLGDYGGLRSQREGTESKRDKKLGSRLRDREVETMKSGGYKEKEGKKEEAAP